MTGIQKNIVFIIVCCALGAACLTWIGIESYPNLNRPSNYAMHGVFGTILGYFFGLICVIVKAMWNSKF
jgi:hypothetical protein